jgi:hypothetical protein
MSVSGPIEDRKIVWIADAEIAAGLARIRVTHLVTTLSRFLSAFVASHLMRALSLANNSGVAAVLEKLLTLDVWVAAAIAVAAVLIIVIFDMQPLLIFVMSHTQ